MATVVPPENATIIRPAAFYISGLSNMPHTKYYYMFLCFVYAVSVLGNSCIIGTIYLARTLHTAKYIAVFNLALSDLCGSSALIPKYADMFLLENQYISYKDCLTSMFFIFLFITMQSYTLLALAFDRVIAICFPLRYHAIVTKSTMTLIISGIWLVSILLVAIRVALITRLSFCSSTTVGSYFCDHGPIYRLACNDNTPNFMMAYANIAVMLCLPLLLIALSYICIGVALLKISHGADRMKAMKTCTSHLMLVAIFYLPILGVYSTALMTFLHPNTRIINSVLAQAIPPMLNPIIYTLKTEEVLQSIKVLYKRVKVNFAMKNTMKIFKHDPADNALSLLGRCLMDRVYALASSLIPHRSDYVFMAQTVRQPVYVSLEPSYDDAVSVSVVFGPRNGDDQDDHSSHHRVYEQGLNLSCQDAGPTKVPHSCPSDRQAVNK
ncbi:olfactory receptor 1F1-like [Pygocentrus nattereri]|uniref:olfactory receptor 1F1-like n=1 Tax=Pygocentrus nattereri TaxID=42514 RepID=UPI0008144F9E|nr:olfactory receptor 1F1-like [Pygocentrus nattereri]